MHLKGNAREESTQLLHPTEAEPSEEAEPSRLSSDYSKEGLSRKLTKINKLYSTERNRSRLIT